MNSLFRVIKRLSSTVHRVMEFGGQPPQNPQNVRCDEMHGLVYGHRLGPAYPPQQPLFLPAYPGDFNGGRGEGRGRGRGRRRCWTWVVGAIILNVLLTCGTVLCLLFALKEFKSPLLCSGVSQEALEQSRLTGCVPCSERVETSGHKCCPVTSHTEPPKDKSTFVEQPPSRERGGQLHSSPSIPRDCGALFYLNGKTEALKQVSNFSVIRGWESTGGQAAFKTSCVAYDNSTGAFTISTAGYYIIYSHLAFKWENRGTRSNIIRQQIQTTMILPMSPARHMVMASDSRAIQKDDPGVGSVPSYNSRVTTVVHLSKGAVLTVEAMLDELLIRDNFYSSFGLFKL